jgi:hypothetical protein
MNIRSRLERLERLERRKPAGVYFWDVILGAGDVADLDDNGKAILQQMLDAADPELDTIEERIFAILADAANRPPSTSSPGCGRPAVLQKRVSALVKKKPHRRAKNKEGVLSVRRLATPLGSGTV